MSNFDKLPVIPVKTEENTVIDAIIFAQSQGEHNIAIKGDMSDNIKNELKKRGYGIHICRDNSKCDCMFSCSCGTIRSVAVSW